MKVVISPKTSSGDCVEDITDQLEDFAVSNQDLIQNLDEDQNRNLVKRITILLLCSIPDFELFQQKSYILDLKLASEANDFLSNNINKLNTKGFFIYTMNDSKTNVINFLRNKFIERMINTIVLNFRLIDKRRSIIDVYTNRYFSNNKRVEPVILGSFIDNKFILIRAISGKMSQISFFPDKLRNLENFHFTVSAFNYPPKV